MPLTPARQQTYTEVWSDVSWGDDKRKAYQSAWKASHRELVRPAKHPKSTCQGCPRVGRWHGSMCSRCNQNAYRVRKREEQRQVKPPPPPIILTPCSGCNQPCPTATCRRCRRKASVKKYNAAKLRKRPKIECDTCTVTGRWRTPTCGVCLKSKRQRKSNSHDPALQRQKIQPLLQTCPAGN